MDWRVSYDCYELDCCYLTSIRRDHFCRSWREWRLLLRCYRPSPQQQLLLSNKFKKNVLFLFKLWWPNPRFILPDCPVMRSIWVSCCNRKSSLLHIWVRQQSKMGQRTRNDDALLGGRFSHKSGVLRLIKKKCPNIIRNK